MRWPAVLLVLAAVALAACGGADGPAGSPADPPPSSTAAESPVADVFPAEGTARATVVLFHGWTDLAPTSGYLPWIRHLTGEGVTVIFPRYQRGLLSTPAQMLAEARAATAAGFREVADPGPVVAVGYSLGGGFAVVLGANAGAWGVPQPAAVYGVFPAMPPVVPDPFGEMLEADRRRRPQRPHLRRVRGDRGGEAVRARDADDRVRVAREQEHARRRGHLAPKRVDDAARRAFWAPLDRIVDRLAPR